MLPHHALAFVSSLARAARTVPLANAACHPRGNDKSVVKSDDATTSACQMIALNAEYVFFFTLYIIFWGLLITYSINSKAII